MNINCATLDFLGIVSIWFFILELDSIGVILYVFKYV
jgi:hypothetical protein